MKHHFPFLLLAPVLLAAAPANAHFLWAQTDVEKSQLRLYFGEGGEGITTDVKPEILAKVAAWKPSGDKLTAQLSGGAYVAPLEQTTPVYGAHQSWGVLDRSESGRGVFRLEYFAKAATSLDKAGWGAKLPLELFARRDGKEALVSLRRSGQPLPGAEVTVLEPNQDKGEKFTADARGQIRFPLQKAGIYALRAVYVDATAGELDGKKYPQTRTWTTLTFHNEIAAPRLVAAPVEKPAMGNPKADPRAYALLESAHNNRQVMPPNFAGFEADLSYQDGDETKSGKVVYRREGETQITLEGLKEDDKAWLEDKVMNLIGHRRGGDFAKGDGKNPLSLVEGDVNAFGQLIHLNDRLGSQYRVKDGKVSEVTRTMGGVKFTITVLDTLNADAGKYLANHFVVSYRDAKTGALQKVEGFRDSYAQIDGVWLPTGRVVYEMAEAVTPRVRAFRLRNIKFLEAAQVASSH